MIGQHIFNAKHKAMQQVHLRKDKEQALRRFHPWVFSGAIHHTTGSPSDGDIVQVLDYQANVLAIGHYYTGSIAVKILSFADTTIDQTFWRQKLKTALSLRQQLPLIQTNSYRLVHGEGDGLPGLIIDYYNGVAVLQAHSIGMHRAKLDITEALLDLYGAELLAVYDKSAETLPKNYAQNVQNGYLHGQATTPHGISENGQLFEIDWVTGQKTGFFLDQRDNRQLLSQYAADKEILNTFCYSGGFSVYALQAGAVSVTSVDSSEKAIALAKNNIAINSGESSKSQCVVADTMVFLKNTEKQYDIIILDPPAYAKSLDARHRALQAYKRLNILGLDKLKPGGILFTFSCSQVVDKELFYNTIVAAGIEAGRNIRVLHHLNQGADHPVNFYHPQGHYLKGLVLYVE
jgi:23S rRNA (cytosine1962-C5)-methyltransferase